MINTKINIEDWFISLSIETFPNSGDYISRYKIIREYMNTNVHEEIKAIVAAKIPGTILNDHGERHVKKVIEKASELLSNNFDILSPYETFFLLLAIQIHDAGHIINGRTEHAKNAQLILHEFGKENLTRVEKTYISQIAKAHSGINDPIGLLNEDQIVSNESVNLKLIASIVRLADELADDSTRASAFLLDMGLIGDSSLIFHQFSQCLDSCISDSNQIRMFFYLEEEHLRNTYKLGDKDIFLLNEIYNRSLKTFTESVYCNRFLPEKIRIKSVNVWIKINSFDENVKPKEISYRLEEIGYPSIPYSDIFDLCKNLINDTGIQLSGEYYNELLMQQKNSHE